jgi:hypothetical protein
MATELRKGTIVVLCKEHNSKQTICENMIFYNCMKFQSSMSHPSLSLIIVA